MGVWLHRVGGTAGDGSVFTFTYGGGGERLIFSGLGLGAEMGSVTPVGNIGNGVVFKGALNFYGVRMGLTFR